MRLKWLTHPSRLLSGNARSAILICFSRMTQLHYLVRINEGRGSVGSCVGPDTHTMKTSPCLKLSKRHELPSPKQFYLVLTPFLTKIKKNNPETSRKITPPLLRLWNWIMYYESSVCPGSPTGIHVIIYSLRAPVIPSEQAKALCTAITYPGERCETRPQACLESLHQSSFGSLWGFHFKPF